MCGSRSRVVLVFSTGSGTSATSFVLTGFTTSVLCFLDCCLLCFFPTFQGINQTSTDLGDCAKLFEVLKCEVLALRRSD